MKRFNIVNFFLILLSFTCCNDSESYKVYNHRDKIIDVSDKIIDIKTEMHFENSTLNIIDNYLVLLETRPSGIKGVHIFDKNTFEYKTSIADIGKGPGEVTMQGGIRIDHENKIMWILDHGKMVMWKFPLDSVLANDEFMPSVKVKLNDKLFNQRFGFLNDSTTIGKAVRVLSPSTFDMLMVKRNLNTNTCEQYGYEHPKAIAIKSNSSFSMSKKNNIYVNCYAFDDLITICNLDGTLKYNIYGSDWLNNKKNRKHYFTGVTVIDDNIIASYVGDVRYTFDENKRPSGNPPSKFLFFDLEGNYIKTIETGSKFSFFCIDEENNRIIAYFTERENPLGYFNLDNLDNL